MAALGHGIVDHVERVWDIRHADHSQTHQVCLLHHHFIKHRLRMEWEKKRYSKPTKSSGMNHVIIQVN